MNKERFVTFCDAIIAIIITIMVLEIHPPESPDLKSFSHLLVPILAYVLSFFTIWGVWRNFHRLFHDVKSVSPEVYWYTGLWLFIQSLFPFATSWVGESSTAIIPELFYNTVMLTWMVCFEFIRRGLIKSNSNKDSSSFKRSIRMYVPWVVVCANYLLVWVYPPIVLISLILMFPVSFMDRFKIWKSNNI